MPLPLPRALSLLGGIPCFPNAFCHYWQAINIFLRLEAWPEMVICCLIISSLTSWELHRGIRRFSFFPLLLKSHVLTQTVQAVKDLRLFPTGWNSRGISFASDRWLISCHVIHRQEMGSLPSPSSCAFPCLSCFLVGMALSPDGCSSALFGGFIWHLPVLRFLCRGSISFP